MDNKNKIVEVRWKLFDYAFGDILRAIKGRSLMGAFILSFCYIDYLAYIAYQNPRNSGEFYKKFIEDYFKEEKYDGERLYAIRCSLVHTYGESNRSRGLQLKFSLSHKLPNLHNQTKENNYFLNLSNFIFDILKSSYNFFEELEKKSENELLEFVNRSSEIINVYSSIGTTFKKAFKEISYILEPLDNKIIDWSLVKRNINELVLKEISEGIFKVPIEIDNIEHASVLELKKEYYSTFTGITASGIYDEIPEVIMNSEFDKEIINENFTKYIDNKDKVKFKPKLNSKFKRIFRRKI